MGTIYHTPLPIYTKHSMEDFPKGIQDLFNGYLKRPFDWYGNRVCVFLWGPEGTGKSSITGLVHKTLADVGHLVYWVDCSEWPDNYVESDEMKKTLSERTTRIVIWDDLGKEPPNTRNDLRDTIFSRAKLSKGVDIFTTNLKLSTDREKCKLTETYGASFRSRIVGLCGDYVIKYDGKDFRTERD